MPKVKGTKRATPKLSDLLVPTIRLFCEDVAQSQDGGMYIARLIDQIGTPAVPVVVPRLNFVVELMKPEQVSNSDLIGIIFRLTVTRPGVTEEEIGKTPLVFDSSQRFDWHRLVMQLNGFNVLSHGTHLFRIYGQRDSEECLLAERPLHVRSELAQKSSQ